MKKVFNWIMALGCAGIVHVGLFWTVGLVYPFSRERQVVKSDRLEISYLDTRGRKESALVMQRLSIFDPRPLLLPTDWNSASAQRVGDFVQEETPLFSDYDPVFQSDEGDFIERFGNRWESNSEIAESQMTFSFNWLEPMGRKSQPSYRGGDRELSLVLRNIATGEIVDSSSLYNTDAQAIIKNWPDWEPATFMLTISDSFVLPGIAVLVSSGYPEVDSLLQDLVTSSTVKRWVLPDGPYLLEVGL